MTWHCANHKPCEGTLFSETEAEDFLGVNEDNTSDAFFNFLFTRSKDNSYYVCVRVEVHVINCTTANRDNMVHPRRLHGGSASGCAYACSRNILAALNSLYVFIGLVLIGIAAYAKTSSLVSSLPVLGGVIACGVFMLLIAIVGLIGAIRHSQVILFFYMIVMSLLFIIQLSVSIGALAITSSQQQFLLKQAWDNLNPKGQASLQQKGDCCGFSSTSGISSAMNSTSCVSLACCIPPGSVTGKKPCTSCSSCYEKYKEQLNHALNVSGGVGLFFAFTLLIGVYLAVKYRNQRDPDLNLNAFL